VKKKIGFRVRTREREGGMYCTSFGKNVDIGTRPGRKLARYAMFCEQILTSGFISSLEPEEWPFSSSDIPFVALL
jgi:hypothetical protein